MELSILRIARATVVLFGVTTLLSAPPVFGADEGQPFVLDEAVQRQAVSLVAPSQAGAASLSLSEVHDINNIGNFGKVVQYERQANYTRMESGLWAAVAQGRFTSGAAAGSSQSLSLCGLVTLLVSGASTTNLDNNTVIPIGKLFVPFGFKSSIDFGRRARAKSLATEYKEICNPLPGTAFKYQIENEVRVKTSGLFGRTTEATALVDVSCQVAAAPVPASRLYPSLRGDYLPVECESTAKSGQKAKLSHAFLKEPGFYILLNESNSVQTTNVRFSEVKQIEEEAMGNQAAVPEARVDTASPSESPAKPPQ